MTSIMQDFMEIQELIEEMKIPADTCPECYSADLSWDSDCKRVCCNNCGKQIEGPGKFDLDEGYE